MFIVTQLLNESTFAPILQLNPKNNQRPLQNNANTIIIAMYKQWISEKLE